MAEKQRAIIPSGVHSIVRPIALYRSLSWEHIVRSALAQDEKAFWRRKSLENRSSRDVPRNNLFAASASQALVSVASDKKRGTVATSHSEDGVAVLGIDHG